MTFQPQFNTRSQLSPRSLSLFVYRTLFHRCHFLSFYSSPSSVCFYTVPKSLQICLELQDIKLTCKEETSIHRGFCHSRLISFYSLSGLSVCLHVKDMRWVCACVCVLLCALCLCHSASCTYVTQSHFLYMVIFDICLTGTRGIARSVVCSCRCVCV